MGAGPYAHPESSLLGGGQRLGPHHDSGSGYRLIRALHTLLPEGRPTVTVELKINFIARAREGELIAEGRISHKGRTLAVGDMTATDGKATLIARGIGTWMILQPRDP